MLALGCRYMAWGRRLDRLGQEVEAGRAAPRFEVCADLVAHGTVGRDREAQGLGCHAHLWDATAAQLP